MSVAKPTIEYAKNLKIQDDLPRSLRAFRRLLRHHKPYLHLFIFITAVAAIRSYLFTLEPLYTSQITGKVIAGRQHDLLPSLVLSVVFFVLDFGSTDFIVKYVNGYAAQSIIRDIRNALQRRLPERIIEVK